MTEQSVISKNQRFEDLENLCLSVRLMRTAQSYYFKSKKNKSSLIKAKILEKKVDSILLKLNS
jgi:hypothetical protein